MLPDICWKDVVELYLPCNMQHVTWICNIWILNDYYSVFKIEFICMIYKQKTLSIYSCAIDSQKLFSMEMKTYVYINKKISHFQKIFMRRSIRFIKVQDTQSRHWQNMGFSNRYYITYQLISNRWRRIFPCQMKMFLKLL